VKRSPNLRKEGRIREKKSESAKRSPNSTENRNRFYRRGIVFDNRTGDAKHAESALNRNRIVN